MPLVPKGGASERGCCRPRRCGAVSLKTPLELVLLEPGHLYAAASAVRGRSGPLRHGADWGIGPCSGSEGPRAVLQLAPRGGHKEAAATISAEAWYFFWALSRLLSRCDVSGRREAGLDCPNRSDAVGRQGAGPDCRNRSWPNRRPKLETVTEFSCWVLCLLVSKCDAVGRQGGRARLP
jgi:hypothetical protein